MGNLSLKYIYSIHIIYKLSKLDNFLQKVLNKKSDKCI